jgi:methyl-accepting chemotaxis protein
MQESASGTSANSSAASAESIVVSENINNIVAGSNQMIASIRHLSGNATQASVRFQKAVRVAGSARDSIGKLNASGKDIKAIVKVVHTISRQTNLLALNAAIEATRAGSAGRAFMVVANEVKELAKEAATATGRINDGIEVIQKDTEFAAGLISEIAAIVDEVSRISESIANTAVEQAATTAEIGRNVSDAAVGSSSIARKIAEVAQVALGAQQGARDANAAAQSFTQMANTLHAQVRRFRVD